MKVIRIKRVIEIDLTVDETSYGATNMATRKFEQWPAEKAVEWETDKDVDDILEELQYLDEDEIKVLENRAWVEEA